MVSKEVPLQGKVVEYDENCRAQSYTVYKDGVEHCDDGPSYLDRQFDWEYRTNGELHRTDGPSRHVDNTLEWYINGVAHREDGPAVVSPYGELWEYYLDGVYVSEEAFREHAALHGIQLCQVDEDYLRDHSQVEIDDEWDSKQVVLWSNYLTAINAHPVFNEPNKIQEYLSK